MRAATVPAFLAAVLAAVLAATAMAIPLAAAVPAGQVPEAAQKACFDGRWLLVQNRLDEAIAKFEMALAVAPDYAEAKDLMAQARTRRDLAQQHYDKAAAFLASSRWDDAIQEAVAALGIYPGYPQAKTLLSDIKRRAGDAFLASGSALVTAGDLRGAESAFRRTLEYIYDSPAAREGLAHVDSLRAKAAAAKDLWGAALVWAAEAVEFSPKNQPYQDQVRDARAHVLQRLLFSVGPEPDETAPTAETSEFRTAAWTRIAKGKPDFVAVLAASDGAAYTVRLEAGEVQVGAGQVRVENRIHRYTTQREEPNPDYQNVRAQLDDARAYLAALVTDYNRPCTVCGGSGWTRCPSCRGTGLKPPPPPNVPCPVCAVRGGRPGWLRCPQCGGAGHGTSGEARAIRRQEQIVAALETQLARTPTTVTKAVPAEWPYMVEFHVKAGAVAASWRVTDAAAGKAMAGDAVRRTRQFEDTTIQNPNPGIGLAEKTLNLPADEKVREAVLDDAAKDAADKVLATVLAARAAALQAESQRRLAEGKTAEAIEVGADAAVVKESVNRGEAGNLMKFLRERLRIEERPPAPSR
jgi:tetratricopeptide (TPR) repeat protein